MKKADELCRKAMICVTLIFLQFSSAFFWLLRVNLKKADELCRKAMICVNFNLPTVFISLFLVTKGDFKKLMNTVGKLMIINIRIFGKNQIKMAYTIQHEFNHNVNIFFLFAFIVFLKTNQIYFPGY